MRYSWAALSAVLMMSLSPHAWAQTVPVYQSGSMSPHHLPKFLANGKVGDVGGLTGDVNGRGVAPFSVQDNLGLGQCFNSAVTAAGYRAFCLGHDASGNALLTVDSYGGAGSGSLKARVNGATVDLVTGSTSGLAAIATSGSASDLTAGTVPLARLSIACGNLTNAGTGCTGALPTAANPTGTAGDVAVNGAAATFMRSDASPAIQKASASVFGLAKVDNTTITATAGVISAIAQACAALTDEGPYCAALRGQLPGTTTNDTATAGNIGEGVFVSLVKASAHALTTGTVDNLITQSFSAGDWEVWGTVCFTGNAATTVSYLAGGITTVSATVPTPPGTVGTSGVVITKGGTTVFFYNSDECFAIGSTRILISGATNVYLVGLANFATNTASAYGAIHGRRVR